MSCGFHLIFIKYINFIEVTSGSCEFNNTKHKFDKIISNLVKHGKTKRDNTNMIRKYSNIIAEYDQDH